MRERMRKGKDARPLTQMVRDIETTEVRGACGNSLAKNTNTALHDDL